MGSRRVSPEEVKEFHRLYEIHGTFKKVAELTGRSSQTVSKYVRMKGTYKPLAQAAHHEFVKDM